MNNVEDPTRRAMLSLAVLAPAAVMAASCTTTAEAQQQTGSAVPGGGVTPQLAAYIAGSRTARIPEDHRDLARQHILDTLASIVACRNLEPALLARKYALAQSGTESRRPVG